MPHTCSKTYQHCVPIQIVPSIQTAANTLSPKTREHLRHEIQSPRTGNILDLFRVIHLYWLSSSIHDWLHMGISNSEINLSGIFLHIHQESILCVWSPGAYWRLYTAEWWNITDTTRDICATAGQASTDERCFLYFICYTGTCSGF